MAESDTFNATAPGCPAGSNEEHLAAGAVECGVDT